MGAFKSMMEKGRYQAIVKQLGFNTLHRIDVLQSLWGGYGELVRLWIDSTSVVVKHITLPKPEHHPRGWNTELSHKRKLYSYQVEMNFYQHVAGRCEGYATVPQTILVEQGDNELLLVMEDLSQIGFSQVIQEASKTHLRAALRWFAHFHAQHMSSSAEGLWPTGTYWHLDTRPDEFAALSDLRLKHAAEKIDRTLKLAPYSTLVHGDGKLANFCFDPSGERAAAVDFQYVGNGCAMKDIALFMSSAVPPDECEAMEEWILDEYFTQLRTALSQYRPDLDGEDVEQKLRPMFMVAWADFQRFVKGWSPNHWKINAYTEKLTLRALKFIEQSS
ncbi:ecdysteroid 22-kinase family protein [Vibrio sinaloensis]|uniref:ecdysteroid 22-kinase family protein n=1 Tax=Photobacterium sp. (strain ATCC 43367) TaxID=379097 RepID=UPI001E4AF640|nr:ecdysteroid 22-kinase family protein [Vibrio sinaloensis]